MKIQRCFLLILFLGVALNGFGQIGQKEILDLSRNQVNISLEEFRDYLSVPNLSRVQKDTDANVAWILDALKRRNIEGQVLIQNGVKHVFAQKGDDPKKKTILVYFQVDGMPVDSSVWEQESPYKAVLKKQNGEQWEKIDWEALDDEMNPDWRIFARSASDSKGPGMTFFSALDILEKNEIEPTVNLKMIFDFQEEISSPQMPSLVEREQELFKADGIMIMDGTRHISNLPTLAFGARGIATITLRIHGAKNNLHSGQYGNFAPNPVFKTSQLLSKIKDENGKVLIPGFYEGVSFTDEDLAVMAAVPESNEGIQNELGFKGMDQVGNSYQVALQYPSLNVRGIKAGWVGNEVRTIIPNEVTVEIDMRTVKETPAQRQVDLVKSFLESEGYYLIEGDPSDEERLKYEKLATFNYRLGSQPFRADLNSEFANWLTNGMQRAFGTDYVKMRQTGGSQPMAPFINILGVPAVSVRVPNPDNNIHAPDENLRLGNFLEGIQSCLALLTQPFN